MVEESKQKAAINPLEHLLQAIKTVQGYDGIVMPKGSLDALFPVTAGVRAAAEEARLAAEAEMQWLICKSIGTLVQIGWKYAGISPETGRPFYVEQADALDAANWKTVEAAVAARHKKDRERIRVPTERELKHIFSHRAEIGGFREVKSSTAGWYWAATAGSSGPESQRSVCFDDGGGGNSDIDFRLSVRFVKDV